MTIAVLMGGISPERNVSLATGKAIVHALHTLGHTVKAIDPARGADGLLDLAMMTINAGIQPTYEEIHALQPRALVTCMMSSLFDDVDIVFIALHGKYGEDGYVQSLCDLRGLRYTGSNMTTSALCMSKTLTKDVLTAARVLVPPGITVEPSSAGDSILLSKIIQELGTSLVVKPDDQGSTVGMSILHSATPDDLHDAINEAGAWSQSIVIEKFIGGRELTVAVLGTQALPVIEIRPDGGFYDYQHKYTKGHTQYICPAELTPEETHYVQELALDAHHATRCTAYSRVDFRLDDDGQAYCLEVNTLPGMTETSLVPKAASAAGMSFSAVCESILQLS